MPESVAPITRAVRAVVDFTGSEAGGIWELVGGWEGGVVSVLHESHKTVSGVDRGMGINGDVHLCGFPFARRVCGRNRGVQKERHTEKRN